LLWLVPAVLLSAWLETNLNASFAGAPAMTSGMYKHFAMDVVAFAGLALLEPMFYSLVWKRQDGTWRLLREFVHQKSAPQWN
jgi:hypothetical protein